MEAARVVKNRPIAGERRNFGYKVWSQKSAWSDWHDMPKTKEAVETKSRETGTGPEMGKQAWNLCCAETETEGKGQAGNRENPARILWRKPDAGNPHVRFDEGEGGIAGSLFWIINAPLYSTYFQRLLKPEA
jgi:hypothetical protein